MTNSSARDIVTALHAYDDLPPFPKVNIHFLATAPGNERLLEFMTERPANPGQFKGKRIGIIATHGVEETEVSIPRKWLEARGATCHLVSPRHIEYAAAFGIQFPEIAKTHVLAIQFTHNSGWIPVDAHIEAVSVDDYDAVYVPGGAWNPDQLRVNPGVLKFLQAFQRTGKPVGALCHGSQVLLSARLLKGRRATGYWNIMEDLANAGADVVDEPVVVDENVITSRFIYDIPQFVGAIVGQIS
ncbi:protease I [Paraburkholderia silvatlantica]|uniref:Protease I n=2 Tax=Paraburkholderia silvatlantica TaxID=321895 RepID=A0A2V4TT39_9BURK|nr:protease I [Paraburkholderia silvatlantica]